MVMEQDTDVGLVDRAATGDQTALAQLFDRYAATLTRYAWAIASSRMDVEEIVQDTFLTLWQKASTMTLPADSVLPWLLVACRNHALNLRRKQARHQGDELTDGLVGPTEDTEAGERLRWVQDEIAALAPTDRRIAELCLIEGHSYAEAAEMLGLSIGAVTQRVSRSRARLRKAVTHDEH